MREAMLYRKLNDNTVQCELCYRQCTILSGNRGYCLSRLNRDGTLYSLIYGVISAIEATPIEDKPFIRFHPGTKCLSIGTFGCNFRCMGCQNHEISWGTEVLDGLADCAMSLAGTDASLDGCVHGDFDCMSPEDVLDEAERLGCQGIAFTYNEPTIWLEYVLDTARLAKQRGLYTVYVTNNWLQPKHVMSLAPTSMQWPWT
jgi:pyruvate formate lyase activating enzyme